MVRLSGVSSNQFSAVFDELARWDDVPKDTSLGRDLPPSKAADKPRAGPSRARGRAKPPSP